MVKNKKMGNLAGIEIFLGYSCNLKCSFCFQKDLRLKESNFLDFEEVIKIIDSGIKNGKKSIIFSGGEVTLDKNILEYIKYSKKKGFDDIRIHTNGITFSDKKVLDEYIKFGMSAVIISIHGYSKIHDYLVKYKGAFDKLKQTFINLSEIKKDNPKFVIDTNTVLNKYNYNSLDKLFKFLSYFPITRSQIVQLYSLYLFDLKEKKNLYISYDKFNPFISSIINVGKNITFENFPLCKVNKKYWNFILKRQKYSNDAYGNMGEGFEESDCTYLNNCVNCIYKSECTGIPKDYLEVFGSGNFKI